jgi:hypothetical protein
MQPPAHREWAAIPAAVKLLRSAGVRTVGLTDGDIPDTAADGVRKLPGDGAPEMEIFHDAAVIKFFADDQYFIALDEVTASVDEHHGYVAELARR